MTNKTKLVWRLGKLPSPEELRGLVTDKIITNEEARDILFNAETEEDRDKKSLESEIKFLRDMVEKLSNNSGRIIEVIKEIQIPYYKQRWYKPYEIWCMDAIPAGSSIVDGKYSITNISDSGNMNLNADYAIPGNKNTVSTPVNFSQIKTF